MNHTSMPVVLVKQCSLVSMRLLGPTRHAVHSELPLRSSFATAGVLPHSVGLLDW